MPRSIIEVRAAVEDGFSAALARTSGAPAVAVTYARKLRRMILAAIDAEAERGAILFELCAEASSMFCHAQSRVEQTHAALPDDQHRAIVAFLEWVADGDGELRDRYLAIVGLRWVWTRFGVDRARATAFFEQLATYRRPPIAVPAIEQLARQIEAAFADTPAPLMITEAASDQARDVALLFHDQRWASLHPALLDLEPAAPSVFTDDAFRYFLPAYLLCLIGDVPLDADPLAHLMAPVDERFADFTPAECAAIAGVLQVRAPHSAPARRDAIVGALDAYWRPRAQP
ncbi:MAG: hypothetical protein NT062_17355 [Proteobacteria bacterium]|nr:hypothetical protein [Pseudomonadota bacterium]